MLNVKACHERARRAYCATLGYRNALDTVLRKRSWNSEEEFFQAARIDQDILLGSQPKYEYSSEEIATQYEEMQWLVNFVKSFERRMERARPWFVLKWPGPGAARVHKREAEKPLLKNESPMGDFKANVWAVRQLNRNGYDYPMKDCKGDIKEEDISADDLDDLSMEQYADIKRENQRSGSIEKAMREIKQEYKEENDGFEYSLTGRSIKLEFVPEIEESDQEDIKPIKQETRYIQNGSVRSRGSRGSAQMTRESRHAHRNRLALYEEQIKQEVKTEVKTEIGDVDLDLDGYKEESEEEQGWNLYDTQSDAGENQSKASSKNDSEDSQEESPEDNQEEISEDEDEEKYEVEDESEEIVENLRAKLKEMCQETLPEVASKHNWRVRNESSFIRVILRTALPDTGLSAYGQLSKEQLRSCIWFGKLIQRGAVNVERLFLQTLRSGGNTKSGGKRKVDDDVPTAGLSRLVSLSPPAKKARNSAAGPTRVSDRPLARKTRDSIAGPSQASTAGVLFKIAASSLTKFQKRVLSELLQIPKGHHTTYAILARHLKSSARAVGNALSTNPFAPEVPCHRVIASGGGIGGFKGARGRNGQDGANDDEKRWLLRSEGVKFDGRRRVLGSPWEGFR